MEPGGAGPRVGPNAVIQLAAALRRRGGDAAERVFAAAGMPHLLADLPAEMVGAGEVLALFRALRTETGPEADGIAAEAGRLTAEYILARRIPKPAQALLRLLPRALALRLLLAAIRRSAWTFGAEGAFAVRHGRPTHVTIDPNPIAVPGCPWHVAVIGTLVRRLVDPRARVVHAACAAGGAPACRFEIRLA